MENRNMNISKKLLLVSALSAAIMASAVSGHAGLFKKLLSPKPAKTSGDREFSMKFGGRTRTYLLHLPPSYDAKSPLPLVVVLHGGGGNAESIATTTLFSPKADREGFIVVYPNGSGKFKNKFLTWNADVGCGYALQNKVDDVGFIRALIGELRREYAIDPKRVYATGISNGAMMSYKLGYECPDIFTAIAPVAGAMDSKKPLATNSVSVIIFHGLADNYVLYGGGIPKESLENPKREYQSVASVVSFWVKSNGCSGTPSIQKNGAITREIYAGGKDGSEVELYTIEGGTHSWPGGVKISKQLDEPSKDISATDVMWEFFKKHPRK